MQDRSFTFILKTPPASVLLQKAAGIEKGSGTPNTVKVGNVTRAQIKVRLSARALNAPSPAESEADANEQESCTLLEVVVRVKGTPSCPMLQGPAVSHTLV